MLSIFKSKTIDFNLIVPAIVALLMAFGYTVPIEVVTGILAIGNFVLRFFTNSSLADK